MPLPTLDHAIVPTSARRLPDGVPGTSIRPMSVPARTGFAAEALPAHLRRSRGEEAEGLYDSPRRPALASTIARHRASYRLRQPSALVRWSARASSPTIGWCRYHPVTVLAAARSGLWPRAGHVTGRRRGMCLPTWDSGAVSEGPATDQIRALAMALPAVTEKQHFKFKVPQWQVSGRTFLGIGRDGTTAVFCITEKSANAAAAADPEHAAVVRRMNAQRSFLGLELRLAGLKRGQIDALVREAWAAHAPKALVKQHMAS